MPNGVSTLLRLASRIVCLIVLASFALFAIDEAGSASAHQQNVVKEAGPARGSRNPAPSRAAHHSEESDVRRAIDDAASTLTSPFKGATAGLHNRWAIRGIGTALALLIYGFGVGYLARFLRVRV